MVEGGGNGILKMSGFFVALEGSTVFGEKWGAGLW